MKTNTRVRIIAPNGIFYGNTTNHLLSQYPQWYKGVVTGKNGEKTVSCFYKNQYFTGHLPNITTEYWNEAGREMIETTVFVSHEL